MTKADRNNSGEALGLIETRGLVGAIAAVDAACKAAHVHTSQKARSGGALVTIILRGDVAAVRAAVEAGAAAAAKVGRLRSTHVIPRPDAETEGVIGPVKGPGARGGGRGRGKGKGRGKAKAGGGGDK